MMISELPVGSGRGRARWWEAAGMGNDQSVERRVRWESAKARNYKVRLQIQI